MDIKEFAEDIHQAALSHPNFDKGNAVDIADTYGYDPSYIYRLINDERKALK